MLNKRAKASLEIRFCPNVELISHVRRFVSTFYEEVLGDADVASRVALTTHELLENGVKYSIDGETRTCLDVTFEPNPTVTIRTWNRASPERVAELRDIFDAMRESDPFEYYQRAMKKSAKRKDGSGLGLARIRAEADMELSHTVEGEWIVIHAEIKNLPVGAS